MTAYGVSSMFFHEYTSGEIFSNISKAGLDGIEYWLETPHFWLRDLPSEEVIACRRAHPEISTFSVHTPVLDLNPCSINPDVAEISVAYAVRSLEMAQALGAGVLTVHPAGEQQNAPRAMRIAPGSTTILQRSARPPLRIRSPLPSRTWNLPSIPSSAHPSG